MKRLHILPGSNSFVQRLCRAASSIVSENSKCKVNYLILFLFR